MPHYDVSLPGFQITQFRDGDNKMHSGPGPRGTSRAAVLVSKLRFEANSPHEAEAMFKEAGGITRTAEEFSTVKVEGTEPKEEPEPEPAKRSRQGKRS